MCNSLVNKYNVAGPRYTSYPTVTYWDVNSFLLDKWKSSLRQSLQDTTVFNDSLILI